MYEVYADGALIHASDWDDLRLSKGEITLELDKAGSFVFSLPPGHPHYSKFVKLKTVITVYRSGHIIFRGRILDDVVDYWNNRTFTCEGELSFLQDSIVRPFTFSGTPADLFRQFVEGHNAQVDDFKRFKIGTVTVTDANNYVARENTGYETTLSNMTSRLLEDATGGHFLITHGDDGTDPVPTIHYLADFTTLAAQSIEFGSNLLDFTKTVKAEDMATAIIPLGATVDDGNTETEDQKLTIAGVNDGVDYVYSSEAVAQYGWIFKVVEWDDVTDPGNLKSKALEYLGVVTQQTLTLELSAVDLHLLDRSVESYSLCEYVRVSSPPHNFEDVLLCTKQSLNVLNPASDSMVLGQTVATFTERSTKMFTLASRIGSLKGKDGADGKDGTVYTVYYLTAPAAGWVQQTDGTYSQDVEVEGVAVTDSGYVDLDLSAATVDSVPSLQSAWALIGRVQTVDGLVRLTCYNKAPAIDLPVQVGVFK